MNRTDIRSVPVHAKFEQQASRTPHRMAVVGAGGSLSYAQLNNRADEVAAYLSGIGVGSGDKVGVCCDRSLEMVIGIYAILKSGAAYVPMDPTYPPSRLEYMAKASGVKLVLAGESTADSVRRFWQNEVLVTTPDGVPPNANVGTRQAAITSETDPIYVIFTSGTTGQPKAASVYHRGFGNLVDWYVDAFEVDASDRFLLVTSLSFDLTQKNLFAPLHRGGILCLLPPGAYEIPRLTLAIEEWGITRLNCTPSLFYPLVEDESGFARLRTLKTVFLGGEPIRMDRLRKWLTHESCRAEIVNTYGPTECSDIAAFYRVGKQDVLTMESVPLGCAIPNVDLLVLNESMEPCPDGEAGELWIGGAGVGAGYINDERLTSERFVHSPLASSFGQVIYRTGDLVRKPDGRCLEFLGRVDHQVKVRGFRIELHEVEEAAAGHEAIRDVAVVAKSDVGNATLHCFYTTKPGRQVPSSELREFMRGRLPAHTVPAVFRELPEFPLSPNGKVDRLALASLEPPSTSGMLKPELNSHPDFSMVQAAWAEVLGSNNFGVDDNFFDIGGDSILAAQVHAKLQKRQARDFPIAEVFANSTVRRLATYLAQKVEPSAANDGILLRAERQRRALGSTVRPRR